MATIQPGPKEKERRSNKLKVEVRAKAAAEGEDESKQIVGYAVKWDQLSDPIWGCFQERFSKGAFVNSLKNNPDVIASWQHDFSEIMGRTLAGTLTVEEDEIGLRYEINPPSWAANHVESIERGDVTGSSFTFQAVIAEWDDSDPDMEIRTITEAILIEVSPVTFPAYPSSEAGVRSAEEILKEHRELKAKDTWSIDLMKKRLQLAEKSI